MRVRFDDLEIDLDDYVILRAGRRVRVEPQVFDVIRVLVEHHGHLVTKEQLLDAVWGTRFVSESSVATRIKVARRALGDDGRSQRIIQTVHGRGYRFVADLDHLDGPDRPAPDDQARLRRSPLVDGPGQRWPDLLERESALATLSDAVTSARHRAGRVVLVTGEPGIGKSSLVRAAVRDLGDGVRLAVGACDDLVTPRALAPFSDLAADLASLAAVLDDPSPGRVQRALLAEIDGEAPTVLVIEDVHWADEATIDVLTHVVRRITHAPVALVLTYRDGDIVGAHPLLRLLGSVPPAIARYVQLAPLSTGAVARIVGEARAEPVAAATGGIPFFVSEIAAIDTGDGETPLPTSVSHAVLSRITALPADTRALLDLLAVEPTRAATSLLDTLRPGWRDHVDSAERAAIVTSSSAWLAFRHELARRAVLESLPASRRSTLHREMARAMVAAGADAAGVIHHADGGGDTDLLLAYAVPAARDAAAVSSHREAWSHLRRLLPFIGRLDPRQAPGVVEMASHEAYDAGDLTAARSLAEDALSRLERLADVDAQGRLHRWLSRVHWIEGRRELADLHAERAVELLEPLGPSAELAWAHSTMSQLAMLRWDTDATIGHGTLAITIAEQVGADEARAHAMINIASEQYGLAPGDDRSMRAAIAEARAIGAHHEVARGLLNLAYSSMEADQLDHSEAVGHEALAYAEEHEIETLRGYLVALVARVEFLRGRWDTAGQMLDPISTSTSNVSRMAALWTLAQLRIRRGDADAAATVEAHRALVDPVGEPQRLLPALALDAERAWLEGDLPLLRPELEALRSVALRRPTHAGRLVCWLSDAGAPVDAPRDLPEPYATQLRGDWAGAATLWRERGMPFEEAVALARTGDPPSIASARGIAERLGAGPLLTWIDRHTP